MNYKEVGLKCGLEIHQQVSKKKLFCSCSTDMSEQGEFWTITRKQRAVAGEAGDVDTAAAAETKRNRTFSYHGYHNEACLVDIDEEPPHDVNLVALKTALTLAKALKLWIPNQIQFMRKTIADGSVCSAFQRTALVGYESPDSFLQTSAGPVKILALGLEEEACKIMEQDHSQAQFSLSRQGIPLIEISTGPDITSPNHMQEVAEKIGMLLRAFPATKRGLGTIRQDVNVSITDGARIEVKGVQDLKTLPLVVEQEVKRQYSLLTIKKELWKREVKPVTAEIVDVTDIFRNSASKHIALACANDGVVLGVRLQGYCGLLGHEIQKGRRFGTELANYAKVAAGVGGIFHSDELPKYGITQDEVHHVKTVLECGKKDAFVLIVEKEEVARRALEAVMDRAHTACTQIPQEVRYAHQNGTSSYQRPMPGAARMYPETDVETIRVSREYIASLELPKFIDERIKELRARGLGPDLAQKLGKSPRFALFERIVDAYPQLKPAYVGEIVLGAEKHLKRNFNIDVSHTDEEFILVFEALAHNRIAKESVYDILKERHVTPDIIAEHHLLDDEAVIAKLKELREAYPAADMKPFMGIAMQALRGKVDGKKVAQLIQQLFMQ